MDVSYRWLQDLIPDLDADPEEVARRLAARGAPVEGSVALDEGLEGVRVARVKAVRDHPDADRLVLCDVEWEGEVVQVVCGAPNVEAGALYPFAPVGVQLPNGMEIGKAKIRGETSHGMLCSEKELGLGPGHEGLLELPGDAEVGASLASALGLDDVRLDVEVTPNRGDLLSHVGVAREVAPGGHAGVRLSDIPGGSDPELEWLRAEGGEHGEDAEEGTDGEPIEISRGDVTIRVEDPDGCSRYLGAVIRGVEVGPSPPWLRARLRAAGARPVNNVVDATNFVLLESGQPLHAFDLSRLADHTVVVRRAAEGETLRTLDGVDRALDTGMLCICDAEDPVAVAGVMGGEESEVGEGTTDILLECALFEPTQVRATRMALGLSTDASYRFERGVDPEAMERALRRTVEVILATAGGAVDGPVLDVHPRSPELPVVRLRLARVESLLGEAFSEDEVRHLLSPLGFELDAAEKGVLEVRVPGWRSYDVRREADVIEEVARSHGYDAFSSELGAYRPGTVADHPLFVLEDRMRDLLVGRGFLEAQVPAFAPESEGEVALANPISAAESHLRSALLPGLLRRVEGNFARGVRNVRLFELGTCFLPPRSAADPGAGTGAVDGEPAGRRRRLPREETHLGLVATGGRRPPHWSGAGEPVDVWDLKGWLEEVGGLAVGDGSRVEPGVSAGLSTPLDDRSGFSLVTSDGKVAGWGGRVAPGSLETPPWADAVWALEIVLPDGPAGTEIPVYREPSPFPGVSRDFALVVPDELSVETVREVIEGSGADHLREVEIFDLYRGDEIPPGTRSVAFRLHFSSREGTLTDREVDRAAGAVVDELEEELGVRPRT